LGFLFGDVLPKSEIIQCWHRTEWDRSKTLARVRYGYGAPGRTRTNTSVRKPDFETAPTKGQIIETACLLRPQRERSKPSRDQKTATSRPLLTGQGERREKPVSRPSSCGRDCCARII